MMFSVVLTNLLYNIFLKLYCSINVLRKIWVILDHYKLNAAHQTASSADAPIRRFSHNLLSALVLET
jgi:hypothetical protein